ncbi:hypothetical protein DL89DRAFT_266822 [Linderina pennispora]|uniref:Uncharacterized protein n=1 Tax=Linderina pennispora TaxID=61395 RepID=A0A1Y1WAR6_9FUNG|nr:uncharacterized protein DL89DRAFT_266822 [Linderina pennispora]ORX70639.1 hypothetical protein DL89DRAFT_266822 [Linderina pennispora]
MTASATLSAMRYAPYTIQEYAYNPNTRYQPVLLAGRWLSQLAHKAERSENTYGGLMALTNLSGT